MCPFKSPLHLFARLRFVQPELVMRDHHCRAHKPNAWFLFFHENLSSGELLAERNLSVRADDLHAGLPGERFHICGLSLIRRSPASNLKLHY